RSRADLPRPAGDEGDVVAAFEDVRLGSPEAVVGVVTLPEQRRKVGGGGTSVVAREHDQGPAGLAVPVERLQDLADRGVDLQDEVAVGAEPALPLELRRGEDRRVRSVE